MKSIEVISIPVTNQERSKKFYEDLGFTLIADQPFAPGATMGAAWLSRPRNIDYPGNLVSQNAARITTGICC